MLDSVEGRQIAAKALMLQSIVGKLFAMFIEQNKLSPAQAEYLLDAIAEASKNDVVIGTTDPALSDLMSAEVEEQTRLFVKGVKGILGIRPGGSRGD